MKIDFVKVADIYLPVNCLFWHFKRVTGSLEFRYKTFYHPCGKCYMCRKRLASQWAFRCNAEADDTFVYNMKFTYADDKLPMYEGKPTLKRQQLQDAFKRLRYYLDRHYKFKIRFFANGEYSPELKRPHYHAIIFSPNKLEELSDKGLSLEWLNGKFDKGQRVSDGVLTSVWPYGIASISAYDTKRGSVGAMVGYMVNYMFTDVPESNFDKFNKPFRMMSRGIGDRFVQNHPKVLPNCKLRKKYTYDVRTPLGVKEVAYPRYYRDKWMSHEEKFQLKVAYYQMCEDYKDYLKLVDYEKFNRKLNELKSKLRHEELEHFRTRKVHKDN